MEPYVGGEQYSQKAWGENMTKVVGEEYGTPACKLPTNEMRWGSQLFQGQKAKRPKLIWKRGKDIQQNWTEDGGGSATWKGARGGC